MADTSVAVFGSGSGALATAGDFALRAFPTILCHVPERAQSVSGVLTAGGIDVIAHPGANLPTGFARLSRVCTDAQDALREVTFVFIVVPAFAQARFADFCAPFLRPDHIVVLSPGGFGGSLLFQNALCSHGVTKYPIFVELESLPYGALKVSANRVQIVRAKHGLYAAAFPAKRTRDVIECLRLLYPTLRPAKDVLEVALRNANPVIHPPIMVLNAASIDSGRARFFYREGVTQAVGRVGEALDQERIAVGRTMGVELPPVAEVLNQYYGPVTDQRPVDLLTILTTLEAFVIVSAPVSLHHRFLLEDLPYGLVPMEGLARLCNLHVPVTTAMIELGCTLTGRTLRSDGRDLVSACGWTSLQQCEPYLWQGTC